MKHFLLFLAVLCFECSSFAQQNIGIGTNSPATKFDVAGGISLREGAALVLSSSSSNDNVALSGNYSFYRITGPAGAFTITGLAAAANADGEIVTLVNTTSYAMTIKNNSTSTSANQITTLTGADMVSNPGTSSITLQYNKTAQKWYVTATQNFAISSASITTHNITTSSPAISILNGSNQVVGGGDVSVSIASNTQNQAGVVSGPTSSQGNLVWGTDGTGHPAWESVSNSMLSNSSVTVNAGTGMSGGGAVVLGGSITLNNAGVTSDVAGTGISVSSGTGAVTISNTGVTSLTAGTGIGLSGSTGGITITNTGAPSSGSNNYIQNQASSAQSASFEISGSGYIATGLGIGTTSATWPLTVNGAIETNSYLYNSASGAGEIVLNSSGTYYGNISNPIAQAWSLGYSTGGAAIGTPVLTWNASGNVGIGTTGPAAKLDVNGETKQLTVNQGYEANERYYPNVISQAQDGSVTGAWIIHSPIPRASNIMFTIHIHGYGYGAGDVIDFTISGYAYSGYNGNIDGVAGALTNMKLSDNGTDGWSKYLGIDANGNVAVAFGDVGNSAYFYRLSADAWITRSSSDYSTGWSIDQNTVTNFNWKDKTGPIKSGNVLPTSSGNYIQNQNSSAQSANYWISGNSTVAGNSYIGNTSAYLSQGNGTSTRLTSAYGYVDIGAQNSSYLHIYTDRATTIFSSPVWSLGNAFSAYSTGDLSLQTNGTTRITAQYSTGNVGIGTTSPSAMLHVAGGGAIVGTTGSSSNTRTITILNNGQSQVNFGSYPGAWTSALQIQDNDNTRYLWLSPLDNASGANARILAEGTGFDIFSASNSRTAAFDGNYNIWACTGYVSYYEHWSAASGYYYYDMMNDLNAIDAFEPEPASDKATGESILINKPSSLPAGFVKKSSDSIPEDMINENKLLSLTLGGVRQLRSETKTRDEGIEARLARVESLLSQLTGKELGQMDFTVSAVAHKNMPNYVIMDARVTPKSVISVQGLTGYQIINQGEGSFELKFTTPPSDDVKFTYSSKF